MATRREAVSAPALSALERLRALVAKGPSQFELSQAALLIDQLTLAECQTARSMFQNLDRHDREIALDALATRWAKLDPYDAFKNAQANRRDNDWSNRIGYAAGAALAERDPEAALEKITSARNNDLREKAAEWILPGLARTQGRRAADFLTSNSRLSAYPHIYRDVAFQFGRSSPQEAIAWAYSLDSRLRPDTVTSAWKGWAEADPRAAAAALESNPTEKHDFFLLNTVVNQWSRSDLKAALAWVESIPEADRRKKAFDSLELSGVQLSPEDSRHLLQSLDSSRARKEIADKMGQQLARENITDALVWAQSLAADKGGSAAMESVLREWTANDPAAAARYVAAQAKSNERTEALARVVSNWGQSDPGAAQNFVETLPAGAERDAALASVIEIVAAEESDKALKMFQSLQDPQVIGRLAPGFISVLMKSDPDSALELAGKIPTDQQPKTYHALVRGWAFDEPEQAGEWINTLSPGPARDSAIKAYVSVIDGMDPAYATKWANSIGEPTERIESTLNAFNRWIAKDRSAAEAWVQQTPIPAGLRPYFDRLLNDEKWAGDRR